MKCLVALLLLALASPAWAQCPCGPKCPGCDCGCAKPVTHTHGGWGFRFNLWIAPRPAVVVAPPPVVAPVQIVYVNPAAPVYPGYPVYMMAGPPAVYYQFIPQVQR